MKFSALDSMPIAIKEGTGGRVDRRLIRSVSVYLPPIQLREGGVDEPIVFAAARAGGFLAPWFQECGCPATLEDSVTSDAAATH